MKVLIFVSYFHPHIGGLEKYSLEFAKHLKNNQIEPIIVTCNTEGKGRQSRHRGIVIYRLDCWHLLKKTLPVPKMNWRNRQLLQTLAKAKPEVIITQTRFFPLSFLGAIFAKNNHFRHLHIEHGSTHTLSKNPLFSFLYHVYDHTFGRLVIKNAEKTIVISRQGIELARHLGGRKIVYIPNSLDINDYPCDLSLRQKKEIIFVGRLIEQKGIQDLIRAFCQLKEKDVVLKIIGKGYYRQQLEALASKNKKIVFLGEKDHQQIVNHLTRAEVFVNPSYLEGTPTSVLEAAACGCPIIATDTGNTRAIIENGKNGFLISPRDIDKLKKKMSLLLSDANLRSRFAHAARRKVEQNFNWQKNIKPIISLLENKE